MIPSSLCNVGWSKVPVA